MTTFSIGTAREDLGFHSPLNQQHVTGERLMVQKDARPRAGFRGSHLRTHRETASVIQVTNDRLQCHNVDNMTNPLLLVT